MERNSISPNIRKSQATIFSIRFANLSYENIPNELQILEIKQRKKGIQPQFILQKILHPQKKPINSNFPSCFSITIQQPLLRVSRVEKNLSTRTTPMQMQREALTFTSLDNDETEDWLKENRVQGILPSSPWKQSWTRAVARFDKRLDGSRLDQTTPPLLDPLLL